MTNNNNPVTNNITNHTTNIHIHIPDMDKHGNFYTKDGSEVQERLHNSINQVIVKHTDGTPAA